MGERGSSGDYFYTVGCPRELVSIDSEAREEGQSTTRHPEEGGHFEWTSFAATAGFSFENPAEAAAELLQKVIEIRRALIASTAPGILTVSPGFVPGHFRSVIV